MKTMNKTTLVIFSLGTMLQSMRITADFSDIPVGGRVGIITTGVIAAGVLAQPPAYGLWSFLVSQPATQASVAVEEFSIEMDAAGPGITNLYTVSGGEVEVEEISALAPRFYAQLGGAEGAEGAVSGTAATEASAGGISAGAVAAAALVVVAVIVVVAIATMPLWLPPILKQSGVANSTLYEVMGYIDFQGAVGSSCSRAHLVLYPYSRKDLGTVWRTVGGDRGRACIPERYGARLFIPMRGVTVQLRGSIKDAHKNMKKIALGLSMAKKKMVHFIWSNA